LVIEALAYAQNSLFIRSRSLEVSLLQGSLCEYGKGIHWPMYPYKDGSRRRPLLRENLTETDYPPPSKTTISNQYSLVAPQS